MREVECPIGLHGVLAVPQPRSVGVGVSHKTACMGEFSLIYPLDEENEITLG